jgi:hypothetical protein
LSGNGGACGPGGAVGALAGGAGLDELEQGRDGERVDPGDLLEQAAIPGDGALDDAEQRAVVDAGVDPVEAAAEVAGVADHGAQRGVEAGEFRQAAGVDVHHAEARQGDGGGIENMAEAGDDDEVRGQRGEAGVGVCVEGGDNFQRHLVAPGQAGEGGVRRGVLQGFGQGVDEREEQLQGQRALEETQLDEFRHAVFGIAVFLGQPDAGQLMPRQPGQQAVQKVGAVEVALGADEDAHQRSSCWMPMISATSRSLSGG